MLEGTEKKVIVGANMLQRQPEKNKYGEFKKRYFAELKDQRHDVNRPKNGTPSKLALAIYAVIYLLSVTLQPQ